MKLLVALFLAGFAAMPARAEILGMQAKRAVSEERMKASLGQIELVDERGAPFSLASVIGKGKPTLVTLWAHWCPNCRAEIAGFKAIAEKCPTAWNVVFVSARRSDYGKDVAAFRRYGLPWKFYNVAKSAETSEAQANAARAFYGETEGGGVLTPQHYLVSETGVVDAIVAGRMDFTDPKHLAAFCG